MKKILVPVDFSNYSEYALEVAASIARKQNAQILVMHMIGLSQAVVSGEVLQMPEIMYYMKLAKQRFKTFLDKEYLKGLQVAEMVQNYKIFSEINVVAQEHDIDLIVMGSHGSKGLSEFFIGSNTEKVVRTSTTPVLIIKERITDFNIKNVTFALDFKEENKTAFKKAEQLFKIFGANMHLLYVNLPSENFKSTQQIEDKIKEFIDALPPESKFDVTDVTVVNDFLVENGIFSFSKKIEADAIAMPTHGRRGLAHFFNGSLSEDIANHAKLPVITFKI